MANHLYARMTPEQDERYGSLVQAINTLMASGTASGLTAEAAARVIAKAVTTRRPRTRYTIGQDAALLTRLARVLSDRTLDRVIAANLRRHYPKGEERATGASAKFRTWVVRTSESRLGAKVRELSFRALG